MISDKDALVNLIILRLQEQEYVHETNEYHLNEIRQIIKHELDNFVIVSGNVLD